jgi:hypothetical protein
MQMINGEQLKVMIEILNKRLQKRPEDKKLAKVVKILETDCLPSEEKYEEQEKILTGRKSYSKTYTDASFMRMKEDHMHNGELKPGYKVQIGTENQFVVEFGIHQRPGDTTCFIPHMERLKQQYIRLSKREIADAGYGSEEKYAYLEKEPIESYVKYNRFQQEQKRSWRKQYFAWRIVKM